MCRRPHRPNKLIDRNFPTGEEPSERCPAGRSGHLKRSLSMTQNDDRKVRPNASVEVWDTHLRTEFAEKDPEATLKTMTATPRVNLVPIMVDTN